MTGKAVANHFKNLMSEYTWPCTIVSDNGPCYISKEFHELMQQKGVNHILVSPHHPQLNGMAEKYAGIMKQLFLKAREEGKDPADALHTYRSTPLDSKTPSPMAILMGRLPCTNLPMSHTAKAKIVSCIQIKLYSWYMLGMLVKPFIAALMLYSDEVQC